MTIEQGTLDGYTIRATSTKTAIANKKRRMMALRKYGGITPKCVICSEWRTEFLCIDHIEGGGTKHYFNEAKQNLYWWLRKNNYPKGFRVLCHNCNKTLHTNKKPQKINLKMETFSHYSNGAPKCSCCGEKRIQYLAIDHIFGGHRAWMKRSSKTGAGHTLWGWLKRNNFPSGYRVLCHNCNSSIGYYGYCPHEREPEELENTLKELVKK